MTTDRKITMWESLGANLRLLGLVAIAGTGALAGTTVGAPFVGGVAGAVFGFWLLFGRG